MEISWCSQISRWPKTHGNMQHLWCNELVDRIWLAGLNKELACLVLLLEVWDLTTTCSKTADWHLNTFSKTNLVLADHKEWQRIPYLPKTSLQSVSSKPCTMTLMTQLLHPCVLGTKVDQVGCQRILETQWATSNTTWFFQIEPLISSWVQSPFRPSTLKKTKSRTSSRKSWLMRSSVSCAALSHTCL